MPGDALRLAPSGLAPGQRVGHYELLEEIGRGGMGIVYRARDANLGRQVALKRPLQQPEADDQRRRRFLREAKAAARLSHPHIVSVFEVFEQDGVPWMAMELVEGMSLRALLGDGHALPVKDVLRHTESLATALAAAHAHHVLHRDIKPGNVLVTADGRALLTDFGLAQLMEVSESATTESGESPRPEARGRAGTLRYMSPEQVLARPLDARSDIFAFGALVYEMCAGRPAFGAENGDVVDAILHRDPEPLERLNHAVPAELERIVRKCMTKSPDERYQDARDLLVDVRALRQRIDFAAYAEEHAAEEARSRRTPIPHWRTGAALAAVLAVAAVFAWQRWKAAPAPPAAVPHLRIGVLMPLNATGAAETAEWPELIQALVVRELTGIEGVAVLDPLRLNAVVEDAFRTPQPPRNRKLDALLRSENLALVIDGVLSSAPRGYVLRTSLTAPDTGVVQASHEAAVNVEADLAGAVGETVRATLDHLQASGLPVAADRDIRPWMAHGTRNVEALKAFLQATRYVMRFEPGGATYLDRAIELDPSFVAPRIWRIPALVDAGRLDEAERHYRALREIEPRASPFDQAMIRFAGAYIAGDHAAEVRHLEVALQYAPGNNILLVNLAESRISLGDCEGALATVRPALEMRWRFPDLYELQGRCLVRLGRFAEARRALTGALDVTPVTGGVYAMLHALALRDGSGAEAARYLDLYRKRCQELGIPDAEMKAGMDRWRAEVGLGPAGAP